MSSNHRNVSTNNELFWPVITAKIKRCIWWSVDECDKPLENIKHLMERQYDSIYDRIFINEYVTSFWPKDMHKDKDVYSGVWGCVKLETVISGIKANQRIRGVRTLSLCVWKCVNCFIFYGENLTMIPKVMLEGNTIPRFFSKRNPGLLLVFKAKMNPRCCHTPKVQATGESFSHGAGWLVIWIIEFQPSWVM